MRIRRKNRANAIAKGAMTVLGMATILFAVRWGWRTFPEAVRYVRMRRM